MANLTSLDWRTIVRRIREGKFTPFISDRVSNQFLPGDQDFIQRWAEDIGYPLVSSFSVTRLAQFLRVTTGEDLAAKEEFLSFCKRHLLQSASPKQQNERQQDALRDNLHTLRLTELTAQLDLFRTDEQTADPIHLLARLPLPIYMTTSYFNSIEAALKAVGKQPRVEICYWRDELKVSAASAATPNPLTDVREILATRFNDEELRTLCYDLAVSYDDLPARGHANKARELVAYLERYNRLADLIQLCRQQRPDISWTEFTDETSAPSDGPDAILYDGLPSVFEQDPGYQPHVQEPLVYHLHGLDICPSSLVLTEDDYLDFLVKVAWDRDVIPPRVAQALTDSSLLLLGYRLQDWDFRVMFRGLITRKRSIRRRLSLAIQLAPEEEETEQITSVDEAQNYLEKYFDLANFKIYWGNPQRFMQDLWEQWQN